MLNFNDWFNAVIGQPLNPDGVYGDQCVDVAESYCKFLWPQHDWPTELGYGNAKDLYTNSNPDYFDKIPYSNGFVPQQGDMVVYGPTNTNPYGHIAVITSADGNLMNVIEQNGFNPTGVAYTAQRHYINVIGYLRPKIQLGEETVIQDTPQERSRFTKTHMQIRGRPDGQGVFEGLALNNSWLHVIEGLSDDPEADAHFALAQAATVDDNYLEDLYVGVLKRSSAGDDGAKGWLGQPGRQVLPALIHSGENQNLQTKLDAANVKSVPEPSTAPTEPPAAGVVIEPTHTPTAPQTAPEQPTHTVTPSTKSFSDLFNMFLDNLLGLVGYRKSK